MGGWLAGQAIAQEQLVPSAVGEYFRTACNSCHTGSDAEAGLDLSGLAFELSQPATPNVVGNDTLCESLLAAGDRAGAISLQYH